MSEQQINIPGLDVILVRGDDAKKFLQGQITNDIYLLDKEDKAIYAGYCNPKGRLIAFFLIIKTWDNYFLFCPSSISDEIIKKIMLLEVDSLWKLLLMMGIGVFKKHDCRDYMAIMSQLANEQHLYLIIASSDYIYGTNYQFCHGYIGKDLKNMTQQKTIQAMGRIGRNSMQQEYTIRFRDDKILYQLFQTSNENTEANVMNRLFS